MANFIKIAKFCYFRYISVHSAQIPGIAIPVRQRASESFPESIVRAGAGAGTGVK